jgi:hypothetical protein
MWDAGDRTWLAKQMDERLSSTFSSSMATLFEATNNEVRPSPLPGCSPVLHMYI